jgi:hypothetical protein
VLLGGVAIDEEEIRRLVAMLSGPLEKKLTHALLFRAGVVALTREGRSVGSPRANTERALRHPRGAVGR